MSRNPPVLCVIGRKNSGKTGLTVALAAEFNRRGLRVMTVKHGHGFQVDQPGKDSWRHRHEGGAVRTVMASPGSFAVIGDWPGEEMELEELVRRFLNDADLVLAEGFKKTTEPNVEVFRKDAHASPLFDPTDPATSGTIAMVTDAADLAADLVGDLPVFSLNTPDHIAGLADFLEEKVLGGQGDK